MEINGCNLLVFWEGIFLLRQVIRIQILLFLVLICYFSPSKFTLFTSYVCIVWDHLPYHVILFLSFFLSEQYHFISPIIDFNLMHQQRDSEGEFYSMWILIIHDPVLLHSWANCGVLSLTPSLNKEINSPKAQHYFCQFMACSHRAGRVVMLNRRGVTAGEK